MAIRYAVASGNWSSAATWDGGATIPGAGDDVYANNFTVSINQTISVKSLKKASNVTPAIASGGNFNVTASVSITIADGIVAADNPVNTSALLNIAAGTPTVTINSNIAGGAGLSRRGLSVTVAATVTINGDVSGGSVSNAPGVLVAGAAADVAINGTVTGGAATTCYGVSNTSATAMVTVSGGITGGTGDVVGVFMSGGKLRLDAEMRFGSTGAWPFQCSASSPPVFVRGGAALALVSISDDDWPLLTGAEISLAESGGGGADPQRFLNVAGVATPIQ